MKNKWLFTAILVITALCFFLLWQNSVLSGKLLVMEHRLIEQSNAISEIKGHLLVVENGYEPSSTDLSGLEAALDGITNFEQGSAGSSLKCVIAAANLLNWLEESDQTEEQLLTAVSDYLSSLTDEKRKDFRDHLQPVLDSCEDIVSGSDGIAGLLDSAGNPQQYDSYSPYKLSWFRSVLSNLNA